MKMLYTKTNKDERWSSRSIFAYHISFNKQEMNMIKIQTLYRRAFLFCFILRKLIKMIMFVDDEFEYKWVQKNKLSVKSRYISDSIIRNDYHQTICATKILIWLKINSHCEWIKQRKVIIDKMKTTVIFFLMSDV
jgi:hypothetical protein